MQLNRRQLMTIARVYLVAAAVMSIVFLLSGPTGRSLIAAGMMLAVIPAGFIARRVH